MASGIDTVMISVDRQLPRNTRIISPVSAAAMAPSRITPETAALTNADWSPTTARRRLLGSEASMRGSSFFTPLITSSVEAEPDFWIVISTAWLPSTRTTLACGGLPSCTKATSRM
jgi:hypothetical protein